MSTNLIYVKLDSQNDWRQLLIAEKQKKKKRKKNFFKNIMVTNVCKFYENHCLLNFKSSAIFNQNINEKMFNNEIFRHICQKSIHCICICLFLDSLLCLTSVTHFLVYNNLVNHEVQGASLDFVLYFLDCLGYFCPHISINILESACQSFRVSEILIGILFNLQIM